MATATTTSPAPRPRGAARREALLEAALVLVAEVGPDAVTHRRVAETAGLPLASTTYWFDSKDELLTAAVELAAARDTARIDTLIATSESGADPIGLALRVLLEPVAGESPSSRGPLLAAYSLLLEAARRPALREVAGRWSAAYTDAVAALLLTAGSRQARADAQLLMAACDGLLLEQLASGQSADLSSRLRRLARALLESS